ncbi:MAG: hypothetical protein WA001_00960 [Patescibacteria group bacterium]
MDQPKLVQKTHAALTKVPEATVFFWITKILTTGMGETTSDYLAHLLNPMVAVAFAGIALVAALVLQFSMRRYVAWVYWLAVIMVSIFGTMAADVLHVGFGIPYIVSTIFFAVVLAAIFIIWQVSEKTLSIHSITTRKREAFYWVTVLTTFALGTAVGDLTATTMHLGYFTSGILFAVLIAIPAIAFWKFRLNAIFAFWFAYIITRPLGASFADWMGVPSSRGGLGLGTGPVSLALLVLILCLVGYLTASRREEKPSP